MTLDVFPPAPGGDPVDHLAIDSEVFRNGNVRLSPQLVPDRDHICIAEGGAPYSFAARLHNQPRFNGVSIVVALRKPFQVVYSVIILVSILVVDAVRAIHARNECLSDEPVDTRGLRSVIFPKRDHVIARALSFRFTDAAEAISHMRHPAEARNLIAILKTGSRSPLFYHPHHLAHAHTGGNA